MSLNKKEYHEKINKAIVKHGGGSALRGTLQLQGLDDSL